MRYTVEDQSDPGFPERCYGVIDNTQDGVDIGGGRYFSKAEAEIIAFALNAVADGDQLQRYHLDAPGNGKGAVYDGPTEGVKP